MHTELLAHLIAHFPLGVHSNHGPKHWAKVRQNAEAIADMDPLVDRTVVQLFAIIHDSKRENESTDAMHGPRAAKSLDELERLGLISITPEQKQKLYDACAGHTNGMTSSDPTIGACWDADRLELYRVGMVPSIEYFSTDAGKQLLKGFLERRYH